MVITNDQNKMVIFVDYLKWSLKMIKKNGHFLIKNVPLMESQSPQFGDICRRTLTGAHLSLYSTMYQLILVIVRHVLRPRAHMPTTHWRVLWIDHYCRMKRSVKTLSFHTLSP